MACKRTTTEFTLAVNSLLHFSNSYQEALVDVIQDYFSNERDCEDSDVDDVNEFDHSKGKAESKYY